MAHDIELVNAKAGTGNSTDFSGKWANELGSNVLFTQEGDALTGVYESAVSSGGGKTYGDVIGHVDGNLISFVVHWRSFQAITAWVGQMDTLKTITTLWQMTKKSGSEDEWASINSGFDVFTKI